MHCGAPRPPTRYGLRVRREATPPIHAHFSGRTLTVSDSDPLLTTYLERRGELLGYFRVRLRSEQAAEDLVQDMYLRIVNRPQDVIDNPAAFLYRLGSNLMLDRMKQSRRIARRSAAWRVVHGPSGETEVCDETPLADEQLIARESLSAVIDAIRKLPAPAREAFRLHKVEGLSHSETAVRMGVSRSSVEKYLMACLKAVRKRGGL